MQLQLLPAFKDAFKLCLLVALIFLPLVGIQLDGYDFTARLGLAYSIIGAIFLIKFSLNLGYQYPLTKNILERVFSQKNLGVVVAQAKQAQTNKPLLLGLLLIFIAILPFFLSKYYTVVLIQCLIYVLLGLGLNIVVGWAGMLDLGFVAFYAVGAYSLGILGTYFDLGFWQVLPIAMILSGIIGGILGFPVLRMHGDYLAIVTLGFGEIIRLVLNNWTDFTGGPNGMSTPKITFFGLDFTRRSTENSFHNFFGLEYSSSHQAIFLFLVLFLVCIAVVYFCTRLKKMPIGRAWEALREDEVACRSMGINHVAIKLMAFVLGAAIAGLGGVFFGAYQGFINPTSFTFIESALIVAIVVLGGLGSIVGVIIAAVVLNLLPEIFREFENFRVLLFGLVMVTMMIWRPRGLIRIVRPRFERDKKAHV